MAAELTALEHGMRAALDEAWTSWQAGNFGIGAALVDPEGDGIWCLEGEVILDVAAARTASAHELGLDRPIFRLLAVTT